VTAKVKLLEMVHPLQDKVQVTVKPQLMAHQLKDLVTVQAKVKLLVMALTHPAQAMVKAPHKLTVVQQVDLDQVLVKDQLMEEMHQLQDPVPVKALPMSLIMVELAQFKAHATLTRI
jgi:hypothetical protein